MRDRYYEEKAELEFLKVFREDILNENYNHAIELANSYEDLHEIRMPFIKDLIDIIKKHSTK